ARESGALKRRRLQVARRCGLLVPDSLVTNSPDAVRRFAAGVNGPLAGKTLAAALLVESGRLHLAYTRRIEQAELADLAGVEVTAHLFQPFLDRAWEVGVRVVGRQVFAARIDAGSEAARVDFRADYDSLSYTEVAPPERVRAGMMAFLKAFGLAFGAFDFVVTTTGEWVFLECNP